MLTFLKKIFTWWNQDTIGTRIKTILFGKFVGKDDSDYKYYQNKKGKRWVIYKGEINASKIDSDWFSWIHYQTDKIPAGLTVPSDATVISEEEDRYGNTIKLKRKKLNPEWDSSKQYVSREDRKEWEAIGLVGKLRLKKGQPTNPNWIKLRDISDTVEEWLVR